MGKMIRMWIGAAVLALMVASCSAMPERPENLTRDDYSSVKEYLALLIKKEMKQQDVTGLSIALVDDQRVIWAEGFGFADLANKVQATPETIYRAGSISKLFTATAALQLVEQGRLDIDLPLQAYLPEFSMKSRFPDAGPITARTIMTHHSGLPSDLVKGMWTNKPEPFENEVNLLHDEYVANPPNFVFSYSNLGVTLLGHAVQKITGRNFPAYLAETVLQPLGMSSSSFSTGPDHSASGAKAYRKGEEAEDTPLRDIPAGGLNTTVLDLSRFMQMVFAGGRTGERQIIKPDTLAEMLRPQNANVPLDLDFRVGLAWMLSGINIQNAGLVAHHGGATLCHRSQLIILPEHKLGIVVLANSATAGSVINKVATEGLKLAVEVKTGIKQPDQKPTPGGGTPMQEDVAAYEGRYDTLAGVVEVKNKSDYLKAEVMDTSLRLVPRADGLFALQYWLLGFIPISLGELDNVGIARAMVNEHNILKARVDGQEILVGERIQPVPIPEKWLQRTGEYEIINRGHDAVMFDKLRLRHDRGLVLIDYSMPLFFSGMMSLALAPVSETEALIFGLGRSKGETIRIVGMGEEELLQFSGYLLKKKID